MTRDWLGPVGVTFAARIAAERAALDALAARAKRVFPPSSPPRRFSGNNFWTSRQATIRVDVTVMREMVVEGCVLLRPGDGVRVVAG